MIKKKDKTIVSAILHIRKKQGSVKEINIKARKILIQVILSKFGLKIRAMSCLPLLRH